MFFKPLSVEEFIAFKEKYGATSYDNLIRFYNKQLELREKGRKIYYSVSKQEKRVGVTYRAFITVLGGAEFWNTEDITYYFYQSTEELRADLAKLFESLIKP